MSDLIQQAVEAMAAVVIDDYEYIIDYKQALAEAVLQVVLDDKGHDDALAMIRTQLDQEKASREETEKQLTEMTRRWRGQSQMLARIRAKCDLAMGIDISADMPGPVEAALAGRAAGAEGAVSLLVAKFAGKVSAAFKGLADDEMKPVNGTVWCTACGCIHEGGTEEFMHCSDTNGQDCHVSVYVKKGIDT